MTRVSPPPLAGAADPDAVNASGMRRTTYAQAARELLHSTLFDAARHELAHRRWNEITMSDIATTAGVSRQRIYKEFGSRDEFARSLVIHEGDRFVAAVEGTMDAHLNDPHAALLAAFELFLTVAAEDPLLRATVTGDDDMLPLVTTEGQPLLASSSQRLQSAMLSRWPQLGPHEAALLAECLVRLAISYATLPAGPAESTAASIAELLGPYIAQALQARQ